MRTLFLTVLILWSLGAWWYYACRIKHACWNEPSSSATTIAGQTAPKTLLFRWSSFLVPLDSGFPDLKAAILEAQSENSILEITGRYFPTESNIETEDMGIARAASIKKLLLDDIEEDRIRISSTPFTNEVVPNDSLIQGIQFTWVADKTNIADPGPADILVEEEVAGVAEEEITGTGLEEEEEEEEEEEITSIEDTEIPDDISNTDYFLKYFPYNEEDITADQSIFLDDLANRLKVEDKKVLIRGHTNSNGDKELNFKVGLRRAKKIRDQLLARGVKRSKIETTSQGEDAPIADNKTEEGRRKNTRIEIFIN